MASFENRDGFGKDGSASHGIQFLPAVADAVVLIAVFLCVVGFLLLFGDSLTTMLGGYEPTPVTLVGP